MKVIICMLILIIMSTKKLVERLYFFIRAYLAADWQVKAKQKRGAFARPFEHTRFEALELCLKCYAVVTVCISRNLITEVVTAICGCIAFV